MSSSLLDVFSPQEISSGVSGHVLWFSNFPCLVNLSHLRSTAQVFCCTSVGMCFVLLWLDHEDRIGRGCPQRESVISSVHVKGTCYLPNPLLPLLTSSPGWGTVCWPGFSTVRLLSSPYSTLFHAVSVLWKKVNIKSPYFKERESLLSISFLSGAIKCLRLSLYISCPSPRISHFSFFYFRDAFIALKELYWVRSRERSALARPKPGVVNLIWVS